ncbi:MAG TPA: GTP cyclohydrolase I FolE [Bauldia sp.]|nr:GTP cyclohydrolase I FolE [Bauldia sp.]
MEAVFKKPAAVAAAPKRERPSREEAEKAVRTLIAWAGDDPDRDGLKETPQRVTDAYGEFFSGYDQSAEAPLERTFEDIGIYDDMVLVRDIPFFSHCEHHMVPFVGKAHVAYYPTDNKVVGLSKLARVVEVFAHRLQTQERLTSEVVSAIDETLRPRGIAVMIEAEHQCMTLRGVRAHGASTVTTQFTGAFRDDPAEQMRFVTLVKAAHPAG